MTEHVTEQLRRLAAGMDDLQALPEAGEPEPDVLSFPERGVVCQKRLGGLLRHYRRAA